MHRSLFLAAGVVTALSMYSACGQNDEDASHVEQAAAPPSTSQVALNPLTIPKFAQPLPIPRVFARKTPGSPLQDEYTVSVKQTTVQMLPPGFPTTTVLAYGGEVTIPNSSATEFVRTVPGPVFETTRGKKALIHWRNEIDTPHFLPVDPTIHWANPLGMEPPEPPFTPFPPGYPNAQSPVPHVTHTHGLMVQPAFDGQAEEWFTAGPTPVLGPGFSGNDYVMPNDQPSTQLFYHDHTMGITRLGVYAGMTGAAYFIRDPNDPLDQPSSPLPKGEFEIPLVIADRAFFTDGELRFPRVSTNASNAYWQAGDGADTVLVNGAVWPNLDVQPRQYRFRVLAGGNGRLFNVALSSSGTSVPFTIIGSDGGYLPAPRVVSNMQISTSERADILVDFSQFPAGTPITMLNAGADPNTLGTIMRFTVLEGTPVPPPPLPAFPPLPTLVPDAPVRIKTLHNIVDASGSAHRSTDGLDFSVPPTEYSLVGSTEQWDILNIGGGSHQVHLHLIEFQVVNRQAINTAAYQRQWLLMNGLAPVTRPIVVDPTPYLSGPVIPVPPYDTGWKDTVRTPGNQVTRIMARWAPQEAAPGSITPGQNPFSIDPTTSPGFVWHCHILGHEDHDMMRPLMLVNAWAPAVNYPAGQVITYQNVNYRVRVQHASLPAQSPPTRFDRYERVNNNDGTWQPQIIYDKGDRVLHNGQLYMADELHQAQDGQTPATATTSWHPFPMTACGQLQELCHEQSAAAASNCHDVGHAGDEPTCLTQLSTCLAACQGGEHSHAGSPCSGLCANPVAFSVPDGTTHTATFQREEVCVETTSELVSGECRPGGRELTVNGQKVLCDGEPWKGPLATQRHHGYCFYAPSGNPPSVEFSVH